MSWAYKVGKELRNQVEAAGLQWQDGVEPKRGQILGHCVWDLPITHAVSTFTELGALLDRFLGPNILFLRLDAYAEAPEGESLQREFTSPAENWNGFGVDLDTYLAENKLALVAAVSGKKTHYQLFVKELNDRTIPFPQKLTLTVKVYERLLLKSVVLQ